MKNALKTLALCSALAASTAALADADQTKLYDPMTAKEKVVINIDLLGKDGNTAVGRVVAVNTPFGVALYPNLKGHKGDLPGLFVAADGTAVTPVLAPKLKSVNELKGHSLMIHVGGDNYHDHPAKLGGGGARMACGIIK